LASQRQRHCGGCLRALGATRLAQRATLRPRAMCVKHSRGTRSHLTGSTRGCAPRACCARSAEETSLGTYRPVSIARPPTDGRKDAARIRLATSARSAPVPLPFGVPPVATRRPCDANTPRALGALSPKPQV